MMSCGNENDAPENSGTNQVQPPVINSGPETEAERATDAVKQDSTNTQVNVGKDEKGAETKSSDSARKD